MFNKSSRSINANANPSYAFSQPYTASSSSAALRQAESNTSYQPLPTQLSPENSPDPTNNKISNNDNNSFGDRVSGDYRSRSPSPNASKPLLARGSPIANSNSRTMQPSSSRSYAPPNRGALPQRGDGQNGEGGGHQRQPSAGRRYGPTASAAAVPPTAALLGSAAASVSDKQGGFADTVGWGAGLDGNPEADDYLHNPDPKRDRKNDRGGTVFTSRGLANIGCLVLLLTCLITLFAGYPIITFYTELHPKSNGGYNLGGINASGQVPQIANFPSVIDVDTPSDVMTRTGFDGEPYNLVFSDEFNKEGRTFFDGDDPYFTAVDLHYWATGDLEWYDPSAITTSGGSLVITLDQENIHELNFKSGMLQSWNQMCFQYSVYVEVNVSLPGSNEVGGFWPGVWMMGNLGRPGYGATTDGTWPYTYAACDLGTLKNQTSPNGTYPQSALTSGANQGVLSYLPGQRMSACTCAGEDHAGPDVSVGRGVPEIDIIEAQINLTIDRGQVSQSLQVAPFDDFYQFDNASNAITMYNSDLTMLNTYLGGWYQEAVSALTYIDDDVYTGTSGHYNVYGFEYYSDPNNRETDGHVTWVSGGQKSWTVLPNAFGPNPRSAISQRLISEEPMALVFNFGMSNNFQTVNLNSLTFPSKMLVDYIRVYQRSEGRMGCDPADHPTAAYIASHSNAYNDPNLTTWAGAGYSMPKNSLIDTC